MRVMRRYLVEVSKSKPEQNFREFYASRDFKVAAYNKQNAKATAIRRAKHEMGARGQFKAEVLDSI